MMSTLADIAESWSQYDWIIYRLGASVLLGAAIGLEREFHDKPAGLRTIMLIGVGACVFSMASEAMVAPGVDPTRIAAQIVTGVGFLGAGSILRSTKAIYGLTTAAGIWGVAAVGMACGFGKFSIAVLGTAGILFVLIFVQQVSIRIARARSIRKYRLSTTDPEVRFGDLEPLFAAADLKVVRRNCYRDGRDYVYTFRVLGPRARQDAFREELLHIDKFVLRK